MNRPDFDWHTLRGPLLGLLIAVLAGIGTAYRAGAVKVSAEQRHTELSAERDAAYRRYLGAENDLAVQRHYLPRYQTLVRRGVIGRRPRRDWVEALRTINERLRLPVLRYQIEPRQPLTDEPRRDDSHQPVLYRTSLRLQASLLHEGDLIALTQSLQRLAGAHLEVVGCQLRSVAAQPALDGRTSNLSARCRFDSYAVSGVEGES